MPTKVSRLLKTHGVRRPPVDTKIDLTRHHQKARADLLAKTFRAEKNIDRKIELSRQIVSLLSDVIKRDLLEVDIRKLDFNTDKSRKEVFELFQSLKTYYNFYQEYTHTRSMEIDKLIASLEKLYGF